MSHIFVISDSTLITVTGVSNMISPRKMSSGFLVKEFSWQKKYYDLLKTCQTQPCLILVKTNDQISGAVPKNCQKQPDTDFHRVRSDNLSPNRFLYFQSHHNLINGEKLLKRRFDKFCHFEFIFLSRNYIYNKNKL